MDFTTKETQNELRIKATKLYDLINKGYFPEKGDTYKIGNRRLFSKHGIERCRQRLISVSKKTL